MIHPISSEDLEKSKFLLSSPVFFSLSLFSPPVLCISAIVEKERQRVAPFKPASSHFSGIRFIVLPEVYVSVSRVAFADAETESKDLATFGTQSPGRLPSRQLSGRIRSFQTHATQSRMNFPSLTLRISQTRELVCVSLSAFPESNNYLPFVFPHPSWIREYQFSSHPSSFRLFRTKMSISFFYEFARNFCANKASLTIFD